MRRRLQGGGGHRPGPHRASGRAPEPEVLGQSEEHTVFRAPEGSRPERGKLRLVPGHVCPTVNLATHAILLEDGRLVGRAEVTARAHEALV